MKESRKLFIATCDLEKFYFEVIIVSADGLAPLGAKAMGRVGSALKD